MREDKKAEEIAVNRHRAISPILVAMDEKADAARITQLKKEVCRQNSISDRTLRRWLHSYHESGFEGLKPVPRSSHTGISIPEDLIQEAILLRREVPSRSVAQIIDILELEGKTPIGLLKRTTLQDRLSECGYSARQMKLYQQGGLAARRFARLERNDLWHSDIKYGPFITVNGKQKQIYLVSFLDDATRYVVHAEFYDSLDQSVVEDCFRKSVLNAGLPKRVYFDNGKQYRTRWMQRACAMLGIKLLYARPYSPESTGKIERFNRTVDSFLDEVALKRPRTLDDYNKYFGIWLQECYHSKQHAGLGTTPDIANQSSRAPLRFLPPETVASAFMRLEQRKVDKSGCISFSSRKYEVGVLFAGRTVDVVYDPSDTETLTIEHKQTGAAFQVKELKIGTHTGPRPKLPKSMNPVIPETSRLLDAKEKQYHEHQDSVRRAIRFSGLSEDLHSPLEGGEPDV